MISEILGSLFLVTGAALIFLAALGVFRFPDFFIRMHAASKATSLGLGCMVLGVAILLPSAAVIAKAIAVIFFLFLTVPVAAHMLARVAYILGAPLWRGTVADELKGRYSTDRRRLE